MPSSFSRLDLPSPSALDHLFSKTLLSHASDLLSNQLDSDGLKGQTEEEVCKKVLEQWLNGGKERLVGNVTIQGLGWKSWSERKDAISPLDLSLQTRVQNLSQTVDDLSEQVTTHRRDLPQRWADALAAREEVMEANREKEEMERERLRKKGWGEEKPRPTALPIERQDQVAKTLTTALLQANMLAEDLPSQVQATAEQHELVEQLRSMPP